MTTYTIKEVAEMTDITISTLRYYEQIGLIDPVYRADNGHRRYTELDLRRIDFLKRLRATGMSISEMQDYVNLYREGDSTLTIRREILQAHRQAVKAQINALMDTLTFLDEKIARYVQEEREQANNRHDRYNINIKPEEQSTS